MNKEERIKSFEHHMKTFDMFKKMMFNRMIPHKIKTPSHNVCPGDKLWKKI
jgi:hypothetical protein